jgi:hypothetical protein
MRIILIVFLGLLLSLAIGSHIDRPVWEFGVGLCEPHGGLLSLETDVRLDKRFVGVVAHCADGSAIAKRWEAPQ